MSEDTTDYSNVTATAESYEELQELVAVILAKYPDLNPDRICVRQAGKGFMQVYVNDEPGEPL